MIQADMIHFMPPPLIVEKLFMKDDVLFQIIIQNHRLLERLEIYELA